ncbi:MAG: GntR family transcriptional regulator [Proteobacteria bacterium]|nr:GntR family transcriptional regulator [Pseudomonadota bacterium]
MPFVEEGVVARNSAVKQIVPTLRHRLLDWSYPPRHQLTEESLCAEFGVSRSPIRQALTELAAEGLLERDPHQSYRVRQLLLTDVEDLYEFRFAIEVQAVRGLARNGLPRDVEARLRKQWTNPERLESLSRQVLAGLDEAFHADLVAAHGNQLMLDQIRRINERLHAFRAFDFSHSARAQSTADEHTVILDRIAARDETGAADALRQNITSGLDNVEITIMHLLARSHSCVDNKEKRHGRRSL